MKERTGIKSRVLLAILNKSFRGMTPIVLVQEMASRLMTIPRWNHASYFNFFYFNSNRTLKAGHQLILNQFLRPKVRSKFTFISSSKPHVEIENITPLKNVARKVLSCQDSKLNLKEGGVSELPSDAKIPFPVTPKTVTNKEKQGKTRKESILRSYIKLTKPNLTFLVTLSSICSYAISPNSVSIGELALLTLGTALCSGSANAINMGREPEFDRRMTRTSTRPVVTGMITPTQAYQFAAITGSIGCIILYLGVNPTVSFLGFMNIGLYAWVYTSLKRRSILNTWIGAIVGAIPPLMGWAASSSLAHPGSWCLAALLYAWQFPHFNALSHNIADQYKQAGYVMTAAENPKLNARVALRYSLLMFPICFGLSYFEVTDWVFQLDSGIANAWMAILAYRFWKQQRQNYAPGHTATPQAIQAASFHARKLFWCSVWQLPVVLVLAMLHKKGQWDRLWHYLGLDSSSKEKSPVLTI